MNKTFDQGREEIANHEISPLVYELFGLTEEEINFVKSAGS